MRKEINAVLSILLFTIWFTNCKKPYEPPEIKTAYNFLVVDGIINTGSGAVTTIKLSRTRRLVDTILSIPERDAQVHIEGEGGSTYLLQNRGNGIYISNPLNLNNAEKYRVSVQTGNKEYVSDYVEVKPTPATDSLTWQQQNDVTVYINTHDPQNNTRYYRWDYVETWEYHAYYETVLGVKDHYIFYRDSSNQAYICWSTNYSTDIVLGSSIKLSGDVISHIPVAVVPQNSEKINSRYSILVQQYALTGEAYNYWQILQKNTQQLGTLFDVQPAQLRGNIRCATQPEEPVIGYISASSVQEKRIFIQNSELQNWYGPPSGNACDIKIIPLDPIDYQIFNYPDTTYAPSYFVTSGQVAIAKESCLDCTVKGGTNSKPSFW